MHPEKITAGDIGNELFAGSMDGIIVFGENLRILFWNPVMTKITKINEKDAAGRKITDIFPEFKRKEEIESFKKAVEGAETRLAGRKFSVKSTGAPVFFDAVIFPAKKRKNGIMIMRDTTLIREKETEQEDALEKISNLTMNLQNHIDKLAAVFKCTAVPVLIYNRKKYVVSANDEAISAYGFNPAGMSQETITEKIFTDPSTGKKTNCGNIPLSAVFRGKTIKDRQCYMFNKDGEKRFISINAAPLHFGKKIDGAVAAWNDITSKKKTEETRESLMRQIERVYFENKRRAEELEIVISSIKEPLLVYDSDDVVYKSNKAAEEFYGSPVEGMRESELLKKIRFNCAGRTGAGKEAKYICEADAPGGKKSIEVTSAAIRINKKKTGTIVLYHDVTDLKNREKDLVNGQNQLKEKVHKSREELEKLNEVLRKKAEEHKKVSRLWEKIFSSTNLLMVYLDRDFNFMRVNRTYAEAEGKNVSFFKGRNYFDLYPGGEYRDVFIKVRETGRPYFAFTKQFGPARRNGKEKSYWDWSLHPIRGAGGKPDGFILVFIDVTKRIEAEQQLERVKEKMERSKRLSDMGALSANIAHELRNPLGVIKTAVFNIKRKIKDPSIDGNINNIEKKIDESTRIINNLLNFARVSRPMPEKIKIYDFINEIVEETKRCFPDKNIRFDMKISSLKNRRVEADPYQIREAFRNLLNNAVQAVEGGGGQVIVVSKITKHGIFEFKVEDNGPGIEEHLQEKVLEPFYTTNSKGTGLGLTISRTIAERY
ncbi:MAG: PAS domain S-box protein, partial [bacterium]